MGSGMLAAFGKLHLTWLLSVNHCFETCIVQRRMIRFIWPEIRQSAAWCESVLVSSPLPDQSHWILRDSNWKIVAIFDRSIFVIRQVAQSVIHWRACMCHHCPSMTQWDMYLTHFHALLIVPTWHKSMEIGVQNQGLEKSRVFWKLRSLKILTLRMAKNALRSPLAVLNRHTHQLPLEWPRIVK